MSEVEVPLYCFGPPRLRAWLYERWDELDRTSRAALEQVVKDAKPQVGISGQESEELKELIVNLDYEHVLLALSERDFERFVEYTLENPGDPDVEKQYPYLPGLNEVQEHPAALRQRLRTHFKNSGLYPGEDLKLLLDQASAELAEACQRIKEVGPATNPLLHTAGLNAIHGAVDRALLAAERFVELTVEFLCSVALRLQVASVEEIERWLAPEKRAKKGVRPKTWGDRLVDASDIAGIIVSGCSDLLGAHRWRLLNFCREWVRNEKTAAEESLYPLPQCLGSVFYQLKEIRNVARHAAQEFGAGSPYPAAYVEVISEGYRWVREARQRLSEVGIPAIVRVVGYSSYCFGCLELHLASAAGFWDARYPVEDFARSLGLLSVDTQSLLVFHKGEAECFLFPVPTSETRHMWNPLIVRRLRMMERRPAVRLRFENFESGPPEEDERWAIGA